MSDKELLNENKKTRKRIADIKIKNSALLYIIVPVVFTAFLLVFIIPATIAADKTADKYIAKLTAEFSNTDNDIIIVDDEPYIPDYTEEGETALLKDFSVGDRIGTLVCENAGVNAEIFYGSGVQIFARGAGLNCDYSLFGENGSVLLEGFSSSGFRNFENISAGDIINITTVYGTFEYSVISESAETADADLVLCSNDAKAPFYTGTKRYICANWISGPALITGEVQ